MVAICNPSRGNWKAMLLVKVAEEHSVVARFEHHESHPGVHVHSHCARSGQEAGAQGMDGLQRVPPAGAHHRRTNAWTLPTFWSAARGFFNIHDSLGPLFAHVR